MAKHDYWRDTARLSLVVVLVTAGWVAVSVIGKYEPRTGGAMVDQEVVE